MCCGIVSGDGLCFPAFVCRACSSRSGRFSRRARTWSGRACAPRNPWAQAFIWIRQNTPVDAVFALDPYYMDIAGEDEIGFRCLAERSRLADGVKDNGVVSMFPPLAEEWWAQVQDQMPWKNFRSSDFARLKNKYGVGWVVVQTARGVGLDCVYQNDAVRAVPYPLKYES